MYGATIGRIAVLAESAVTNQAVCGCTPIDGVFNEFLFYFLLSQREHFRRASEGGAQPNVSKVKIVRSPFPLPPTSEQHRIVERVDELMAVCDGIEARIGEREARRERLTMACFGRLNTSEPAATELTGDTRFALDTLPILTARRGQIQQLRQTVVNLAVLGRLVPQDSAEEPASALLARIKNRKRELGQARVTQNATSVSVTDASIPFAPPKGWIWAQWHDLTLKIGDVDHKMPESVPDGVPYVSPRDFAPLNTIDFDRAKRISSEDYRRLAAKIRPEAGDLIYARYGTIGECRLVKVHRDFLASYSCAVIKTVPGLSEPEFQYLFSLSDVCKDQARIAENRTTQANVGIKSIKEFVVPVPPLAEQRRIVGKVNELMALCDRLEASVSNAENTRSRLLEALLADALAPVARELHAAH
jgi:type I restriction enzyme S subunit